MATPAPVPPDGAAAAPPLVYTFRGKPLCISRVRMDAGGEGVVYSATWDESEVVCKVMRSPPAVGAVVGLPGVAPPVRK